MERRVFPEGKDPKKRPYEDLRWSRFKHFAAAEMFEVINDHVFPFLRTLGGAESSYSKHMKDARFTIPTPALLARVVDMIDHVPMEDRDTKGDLYEYMLGKIASAGQNGQFLTPRHIIQLMVELAKPVPTDVMCDPAGGTCGFPVAVGEYLRHNHPEVFRDNKLRKHFHHELFHAFDFDNTMLRNGSMNMLLHGVENPDIRYRDSLAQDHAGEEKKYTLVLANPPFAGSLDYETCAKDLLQIVKTKKIELLFTKTNSGGTDHVWFYDVDADGMSLDDKRTELLPGDKQGPVPKTALTKVEHAKNNLPDIVARWHSLSNSKSKISDTERKRSRTAQSFCVPKSDIAAQGYDLSLNRHKEVVHEEVEHRPPLEIMAELDRLEEEIQTGMNELRGMLKCSWGVVPGYDEYGRWPKMQGQK